MAAERLRAAGERRVGLVFVVGEERGSDGARTANGHRLADGCRYLVNGEPTDGRLATATRGILRVKLSAKGRAAHSSRPDLGESAIDKLLDALVRLRAQVLPDDPLLGRTHYTIGLISGGIAPNVVSPHAEAEVMFRTVGPLADLEPALASIRDLVHTTPVLEVPAVHLTTLDGFDDGLVPLHHRHPVSRSLGTAAAGGTRIGAARAHRRRARRDRRAGAGGGYLRSNRQATAR